MISFFIIKNAFQAVFIFGKKPKMQAFQKWVTMAFFVRHSAVTVLFLQGLREVLRENVGKKYYLTYKIGLKKLGINLTSV